MTASAARALPLLLGLAAFVVCVTAIPVTWVGSASNDYMSGPNWSTGQTPSFADDVTIPANANVLLTTSVNVSTLRVQSGGALTVTGSVTFGRGILIDAEGIVSVRGGALRTWTLPSASLPPFPPLIGTATVTMTYPTITVNGELGLLSGAVSGLPTQAVSMWLTVSNGGSAIVYSSVAASSLSNVMLSVNGTLTYGTAFNGAPVSKPAELSNSVTTHTYHKFAVVRLLGAGMAADRGGMSMLINSGQLILDSASLPAPSGGGSRQIAIGVPITNTATGIFSAQGGGSPLDVLITAAISTSGRMLIGSKVTLRLATSSAAFQTGSATQLATDATIRVESGSAFLLGDVNTAAAPAGALVVLGKVVVVGRVFFRDFSMTAPAASLTLGSDLDTSTSAATSAPAPAVNISQSFTWGAGTIACVGLFADVEAVTVGPAASVSLPLSGWEQRVLRHCTLNFLAQTAVLPANANIRMTESALLGLLGTATLTLGSNSSVTTDGSASAIAISGTATLSVAAGACPRIAAQVVNFGGIIIAGATSTATSSNPTFSPSAGNCLQLLGGGSPGAVTVYPASSAALLHLISGQYGLPSSVALGSLDVLIDGSTATSIAGVNLELRGVTISRGALNVPAGSTVTTAGPFLVGTLASLGTVTGQGQINPATLTLWGGTCAVATVMVGAGGMHVISGLPKAINSPAITLPPGSVSVVYPGSFASVTAMPSLWHLRPNSTLFVSPNANITLSMANPQASTPSTNVLWLEKATLVLGLPLSANAAWNQLPARIDKYVLNSGGSVLAASRQRGMLLGVASQDGFGSPRTDTVFYLAPDASLSVAAPVGATGGSTVSNSYGGVTGMGNLVLGEGDHTVRGAVNVTTLSVLNGGQAFLAQGCRVPTVVQINTTITRSATDPSQSTTTTTTTVINGAPGTPAIPTPPGTAPVSPNPTPDGSLGTGGTGGTGTGGTGTGIPDVIGGTGSGTSTPGGTESGGGGGDSHPCVAGPPRVFGGDAVRIAKAGISLTIILGVLAAILLALLVKERKEHAVDVGHLERNMRGHAARRGRSMPGVMA